MYKSVLVIAALVLCSNAKPKKVKCPDYCICDIFQDLNRATCTDRRLYSIEIDMPAQAEILNLAFNQISELGNNIFLEIDLTDLKLLNLTHNKVSQIHLNGFQGLGKLKTLDLSYNSIRYFIASWFVSLSSLQEFYLRGNNLRTISTEPLIDLKYLRVLDLGSCGITSFSNEIFTKLPSLESLDISDNYLTTLEPQVLYPLHNLRIFTVKNNPFDCRELNMVKIKNYTMNNFVRYLDPCQKEMNKSMQFEKIMIDPDLAQERNIWIFDEDEENSTVNTKIIEICGGQRNETKSVEYYLVEIIMLSPLLSVLIIFITGLIIGLIIGCAVEISPKAAKKEQDDLPDGYCVSRRNSYGMPVSIRPVRERANTFSNMRAMSRSLNRLSRSISVRKEPREEGESLMMSQFDLADSTPVSPRKVYVR